MIHLAGGCGEISKVEGRELGNGEKWSRLEKEDEIGGVGAPISGRERRRRCERFE